MKQFIVAAVSRNTNSFGLRGMILIAKDGEAWQVAANCLNIKSEGEFVNTGNEQGRINGSQWATLGFEIPRRLPDAPLKVLKELFGDKTIVPGKKVRWTHKKVQEWAKSKGVNVERHKKRIDVFTDGMVVAECYNIPEVIAAVHDFITPIEGTTNEVPNLLKTS